MYLNLLWLFLFTDVQKMECIPKPYSRDELLYLSLSALSKKCPPELSYLSKVFPDVCFTEVRKHT